MPIYHDYHGDFQNSTNSSYDQIQASPKILLHSYQPIPSDFLDELSFLSFQKQKRICAEIKEVCNNICATLNEMIQEEEENSYPESQAQMQQVSDSEIHVQIHPDQESEIQNQNVKSGISKLENGALQIPEFTASTKPQFNSKKQNKSQFQTQYDEDEDELEEPQRVVVVHRLPPELPDLQSLAMGEVPTAEVLVMTEAITRTLEDLKEVDTGVRSGVEDGAVAKGKVVDAKTELFSHLWVDNEDVDMHCGAEAGDVDDGKSEIATFVEGAPRVTGRCLQALWFGRVCPMVAKPPPLLAAVFSWTQAEATRTELFGDGVATRWLAEQDEKARKVLSPPWLVLERAAGPFSATMCPAFMADFVGGRFWKEGEGCTTNFALTCSNKCGLLLLMEAKFFWTQQPYALIIHGPNDIFLLLVAEEKFYQWNP
ncbi:hypothetical protein PIB30_072253, partial [Stylosanthes scabra]|nr:hypothetical protein [Stylosanthes scabra]